jgi:hypothetical protein
MGVPSTDVTVSCDMTFSFPACLELDGVVLLNGMMPQTKALTPSRQPEVPITPYLRRLG